MTDEEVKEINILIKTCKFCQNGEICILMVLPCTRTIDKGKCPIIIDFLKKKNK